MFRFVALLAAALALRLAAFALQHGQSIDKDGAEYARLAQNLHDGHGYLGMRGWYSTEFPPLYPSLIALALLFVGDAQTAGELVAVLCSTALVAFTWLLTREIGGTRAAFAAGAFVAVTPLLFFISTAVLADAPFEAGIVAGAWLLVRALGRDSLRDGLFALIAFTLAGAARPEGLALLAVASVILAVGALRRHRPVRVALVPVVAGAMLVAANVGFTALVTGQPTLEGKAAINMALAEGLRTGKSYLAVANAVDANGTPIGPEVDPRFYEPGATPPLLPLGERIALMAQAEVRHVADVATVLSHGDCGYGLLLPFAFVGALSLRTTPGRRRNLLALAVILATLYLPLAFVWHFWARYAAAFVPFVAVLAALGVMGLDGVRRSAHLRRLGIVVAGLFVVIALANDVRIMRAQGEIAPEREAGDWVAAHARGPHVVDVSDRVAYYGNATWSPLPYGSPAAARAYLERLDPTFIVIDSRRASQYGPLAPWFDAEPPRDRTALVHVVANNDGSTLRIYRWEDGVIEAQR